MSNSAFQTILLILPREQLPPPFFAHFACCSVLTQHSFQLSSFRAASSASGSKHVTHQRGLCFQRCVWRVSRSNCIKYEAIFLFFRSALLSHPLLSLPGKCNLAASLNCVCAASKLLSKPISSSSSTPVFSTFLLETGPRPLSPPPLLSFACATTDIASRD